MGEKHKTLKQWHYANLGRKFAPHLSGYNAGHLADAWQYQQKKIEELEKKLAEAKVIYECWQDQLPSMAHPLYVEIADWIKSLEEGDNKQ